MVIANEMIVTKALDKKPVIMFVTKWMIVKANEIVCYKVILIKVLKGSSVFVRVLICILFVLSIYYDNGILIID